jgi:hypothetical protein
MKIGIFKKNTRVNWKHKIQVIFFEKSTQAGRKLRGEKK